MSETVPATIEQISDADWAETPERVKHSVLGRIAAGALESAVKQIGRRLQISGARWRSAAVNPMLSLRCAYLSGQLAS